MRDNVPLQRPLPLAEALHIIITVHVVAHACFSLDFVKWNTTELILDAIILISGKLLFDIKRIYSIYKCSAKSAKTTTNCF